MPPRICFVSPHAYGYFNPDIGYTGGGAERQIYLLSTALADRFDVHVVVGDYGQPQRETRDGVTLHRAYPLQSRQHPLQPVKHLFVLARAMRRADASLYLFRGGPKNAAFVYLLARLLRRKYVYNVANDEHLLSFPDRLPGPVRRLFVRSIRNADGVIAQTSHQHELLDELYGVTSTVVPNGYPPADDPAAYDTRDYFLWVGRLTEAQKRPHVYLELAAEVPEAEFRLVGPVDESNSYQRNVRERAAELDNVEFVGEVPPTEIHDLYRHAIAFVSTSAFEGFPNTFLEAWRQGTPVVSLSVDASRFLDTDTATTFADGDRDRLRTLVCRLADDAGFRERVGRTSRACFERRYSLDRVTTEYATALERGLTQ